MKILVIDDDTTFRDRLCSALRKRDLVVREASNHSGALVEARTFAPDRAILDLRLRTSSGLDLVPPLLEISPTLQIVILTGYGSIATAQEAIRRGAYSYLTKPCSVERILAGFEPVESQAAAQLPIPSLNQVEWEHLQRILTDCGGNVTKAAKKLGIDRRSLQRRLAKAPRLA